MKTFLNIIFYSFLLSGIYVFYLEPKFFNHSKTEVINYYGTIFDAKYEIDKLYEDFSIPGRSRQTWTVRTKTIDYSVISKILEKTAMDIQRSFDLDVVNIYIVDETTNEGVGSIFYAPDGKGLNGEENWIWSGGIFALN